MAADAQSSQSDERLTSLSRSARFAAVDARQAITPVTEPARPQLSVARMVMLTSVMTLARSLGVERAVIFHFDDVGMCHAQIERARSAGIRPTHIDAHMAAAMLPDLLLENVPPIDMSKSWQDALEEVFVAVYRSFLGHRHVTQAIAESPVFGPAQAEIIEGVLVRLDDAGFDDRDAFALQRTLATYTLGFAMFSIVETEAGADRPRAAWTHTLDDSRYPHVARLSQLFGAEVSEQQYLAGLRRILGA